ncbi:MAG: methane monooxygenase/ammonia monooxygenase subunit C [Gammaproteobacteria bacterium]|nr:methane monooxygenase/ammonia monooxygenase subunit C [Gammaproteobacteria bacterium]
MAITVNTPSHSDSDDERSFLTRCIFPYNADGAPRIPVGFAVTVMAVLAVLIGLYRWYMEATAFTVGLDYFEPEFQTYWMSWLYGQLGVIALVGAIGVPYCFFTRPSKEEVLAMSAKDELGVYVFILTIMTMASVLVPVGLGLFVEADAAWHQVTIRDTDFTPTHIQLFYGIIPAGATALIIGILWMHTRLPNYVNRVSVPLVMVAAAPLLIMPNLGYNEWGHTFFYAEELFAAPVHWGFVMLGWGFFAISGFILEVINRMLTLTKIESNENAAV